MIYILILVKKLNKYSNKKLHLSLGTASVHAWDMSFHVLEIIFLAYCSIDIMQIGIHPCFIMLTCFPCPVC